MGKLLPLEKGSKRTLTGAKHGYGTNMKHRFNLVQLKNKFFSPLKLVKNTKCSLEVYKAGLILSGDFCENYKHISVLSNEVCSMTLNKPKL